jgi:PKD repeat protein
MGYYWIFSKLKRLIIIKNMYRRLIPLMGPFTIPPVANFSGNPLTGSTTVAVNFTDLSTNTPTNWSWNFGDGGTSTNQNPTYTYDTPGQYTVTLTASNSAGSDTETKSNYVQVSAIWFVGGSTFYDSAEDACSSAIFFGETWKSTTNPYLSIPEVGMELRDSNTNSLINGQDKWRAIRTIINGGDGPYWPVQIDNSGIVVDVGTVCL